MWLDKRSRSEGKISPCGSRHTPCHCTCIWWGPGAWPSPWGAQTGTASNRAAWPWGNAGPAHAGKHRPTGTSVCSPPISPLQSLQQSSNKGPWQCSFGRPLLTERPSTQACKRKWPKDSTSCAEKPRNLLLECEELLTLNSNIRKYSLCRNESSSQSCSTVPAILLPSTHQCVSFRCSFFGAFKRLQASEYARLNVRRDDNSAGQIRKSEVRGASLLMFRALGSSRPGETPGQHVPAPTGCFEDYRGSQPIKRVDSYID